MIALQLTTILFSLLTAWVNKIPVIKMRDFGASIREEKAFHRANLFLKGFWVLVSLYLVPHVLTVPLVCLIQWVVFDIALNLMTGKEWDYVGETAKSDKWLRSIELSGEDKTLFSCCAILVLNIFYSYL
jgi:hypothetical protein